MKAKDLIRLLQTLPADEVLYIETHDRDGESHVQELEFAGMHPVVHDVNDDKYITFKAERFVNGKNVMNFVFRAELE